MVLGKDDVLLGTMQTTPSANASFKRPPLRVGKLTGVLFLQPGKKRERSEPWLGGQAGLDLGPNLLERVLARTVFTRSLLLRRQKLRVAILARGLLIHAGLP